MNKSLTMIFCALTVTTALPLRATQIPEAHTVAIMAGLATAGVTLYDWAQDPHADKNPLIYFTKKAARFYRNCTALDFKDEKAFAAAFGTLHAAALYGAGKKLNGLVKSRQAQAEYHRQQDVISRAIQPIHDRLRTYQFFVSTRPGTSVCLQAEELADINTALIQEDEIHGYRPPITIQILRTFVERNTREATNTLPQRLQFCNFLKMLADPNQYTLVNGRIVPRDDSPLAPYARAQADGGSIGTPGSGLTGGQSLAAAAARAGLQQARPSALVPAPGSLVTANDASIELFQYSIDVVLRTNWINTLSQLDEALARGSSPLYELIIARQTVGTALMAEFIRIKRPADTALQEDKIAYVAQFKELLQCARIAGQYTVHNGALAVAPHSELAILCGQHGISLTPTVTPVVHSVAAPAPRAISEAYSV